MSQENVEIVRANYERWNAGKGLDPQLLTPDVEFRQPEIGGDADYHGREGVARGIEELTGVFDELRAEPENFFVAGPYVVVFVRLSGVAKGSGVAVEMPLAHLFRFRGKQVDRWHAYTDRNEALKAAGLEG
jgi:ketosteroid isomerase-like protein